MEGNTELGAFHPKDELENVVLVCFILFSRRCTIKQSSAI